MLGGAPAAVPQRPRHVDRRVPRRSSSRRCAGRCAGSGARSRSRRRRRAAAARWRRRRRRGNRRTAARCSSACRSGRAFSARGNRASADRAARGRAAARTVLSALGVAVAASLPVSRRRSASATPRWLAASSASSRWCDDCASADDTSLGGIRPDASRARTSLDVRRHRVERSLQHRFGLARGHHRPEGARDLQAQVGAGGVEVLRDRAALGARRTLERVGPAAGVDRPLQIDAAAVVVGDVGIHHLRRPPDAGRDREHVDVVGAGVARLQRHERTIGGLAAPRSRSRRLPRAPRARRAGGCWRAPGQSPRPASAAPAPSGPGARQPAASAAPRRGRTVSCAAVL